MATKRKNKRKQRRRGRFGFLYKLVSFVLILFVIISGCAVFFRVDEITVTGQIKYTSTEIIDISGIQKGDNLFAMNKNQASQRIWTTLPYIDEVTIRRTLPDGLAIHVTECTPALLIQGGTVWWVADSKGKLLEQVNVSTVEGTARVTGLNALLPIAGTMLTVDPAEDSKLQILLNFVAALDARDMMDKTSSVDLTGAARVTFLYDGRFTVVLPIGVDFDRAARALQITVEENLQPNDTGKIDMTRMTKDKEIVFSPN